MSHTPLARNLWGDDLIKAIARYTGKGLLIAEAKLTGFDLMVAHTVKTIRIKGGYKQSVMAQALGLSQGYYCKMEKGIKPITIGQFDIIARQLNVSVTEILQISYNKA